MNKNEGPAKGGAAARGEKKRRQMHGVKPGRGSAGRANARAGERVPLAQSTYFPDVAAACTAWLRAKGLPVNGFGDVMRRDIASARAGH